MKLNIKHTRKNGGTFRIYLPKHIGMVFEGEAECLANDFTLTIIRPGVPLEQVKDSLQIFLKDIELRIKAEEASAPAKE